MQRPAPDTVPELDLPGVRHGFFDRRGGESTGALATLNLALRADETEARLVANWSRVAETLGGVADAVVLLDQVHGGEVVVASRGTGPLATLAPADGVVTAERGLLLAIRTADCVPVLLAAPGGVGAAHAGWRGVAAEVVPATVRALCEVAGCAPDAVVAAVGPHICAHHYETGPEVVDGIARTGVARAVFVREGARAHVDLRAAVVAQLEAAGVHRIGHVHRCTHGDRGLYSHRRDGPETGRQAAVIGWFGP